MRCSRRAWSCSARMNGPCSAARRSWARRSMSARSPISRLPDLALRIPSLLLELVRKELIRPSRSDFARRGDLRVPPSPDPGRRLRRGDQGVPGRPPRPVCRLARVRAAATGWPSMPRSSAGTSSRRIGTWRSWARSTSAAQELARRAADRLAGAGWTASSRGDTCAGVKLRNPSPHADGARRSAAPAAPRRPRRCPAVGWPLR